MGHCNLTSRIAEPDRLAKHLGEETAKRPLSKASEPHIAERKESYPANNSGVSNAHLAGLAALHHDTMEEEMADEEKRLARHLQHK